jgi:uncharacterized protein (TIGR02597 family)
MNTTALRLRHLALAAIFAGSVASVAQAQTTAFTDPVGYYTLTITGGADNVMSLPMVRDAAFAGTVASGGGSITANSFTALAGASSPNWTTAPKQWVYVPVTQRLTYYVEFTSGALKGLIYRIADNTANTLTLDTEGESLLLRPLPGAPAAALASGDSFKIRPFWNVKDVFEVGGVPILRAKASAGDFAFDTILFPTYADVAAPATININKGASLSLYYSNIAGQTGWKAQGQSTSLDFGDQIFRPSEAIVVRRKDATSTTVTNLGTVLMNRSIYFFLGGNAAKANDTYFSITRPASVKLDDSGVRTAAQATSPLVDTPTVDDIGLFDVLLEFNAPALGAGFNLPPASTYYYLAGAGWRKVGSASTTIGQDVFLDPGKGYILRKAKDPAGPTGRDWVNDPNY